jgi:hypothetical protein
MIFQRSLACATKKARSLMEGSTTTTAVTAVGRGAHLDSKNFNRTYVSARNVVVQVGQFEFTSRDGWFFVASALAVLF